ncbi:MAG: glycosyltransferase, partial [Lachnospiraceae bacterium]|nr:glycosyltransferase [Lachnospiraceae bacterium]
MPKVSVIVPVYNAEKTLVACISNLVNQTLEDIELIFINDASTDGSLRILLDCEKQFSDKVIIVNLEENSGPGGARNAGLAYASGDYIGFADSDDMVDVTMYEKLLKRAEDENADMVDAAYFDEASDTCILQTSDGLCGELDDAKRSALIAGGGYLWSRLFRRELFDGITFREKAILEDLEVMMELFMRTRVLANIHDVLY